MNELPTTPPRPTTTRRTTPWRPMTTETNRRAQLLSTEHWSLLATRSMSWNEAFSRTGMFLSTLSAGTVALALAGPAMQFGSAFPLFALVVLSVTLFLGLATYVRLLQVNNEDLYWVAGMNIIRNAYTSSRRASRRTSSPATASTRTAWRERSPPSTSRRASRRGTCS